MLKLAILRTFRNIILSCSRVREFESLVKQKTYKKIKIKNKDIRSDIWIYIYISDFSSFAYENFQLWKCPSPYGEELMHINILLYIYIYRERESTMATLPRRNGLEAKRVK